MTKELMSIIHESSKNPSFKEDLEDFNKQHQAIINGADSGIKSIPYNHNHIHSRNPSESEAKSSDSRPHSLHKHHKTKLKKHN